MPMYGGIGRCLRMNSIMLVDMGVQAEGSSSQTALDNEAKGQLPMQVIIYRIISR